MHFVMTEDFKPEIKVDNFDAWNCDFTIGVVIHAVMKEYLRQDCGHGRMDIEDAPGHFHDKLKEEAGNSGVNGYCLEAWNWMIGEIIWATDMAAREEESFAPGRESSDAMWVRRSNAMRLFGKYFFGFWN
jgi:hypothetical protein